jgi:hypothetical protein
MGLIRVLQLPRVKVHQLHRVAVVPQVERADVAQTSESAVSRISKSAGRPPVQKRPDVPSPCRLGSRRHGRFGNLRYVSRQPSPGEEGYNSRA